MYGMQLAVFLSTVIIALLSGTLALFLTGSYLKKKVASYAFWAAGLWLFMIGVVFEILFSAGIYGEALIDIYLLIVVVLVEMLAIGSVYLSRNSLLRGSYIAYAAVIGIANLYVLATAHIGNILSNYVVYGTLPIPVIVASSLGTFPAAVLLILFAALSFRRSKNWKMLSIIAGTVVVSIAGTLYIAAYPEFLYYSEFFGILLLWFGFFDFKK